MDETVVGEDGTAPRPGVEIGDRLRTAREQAGLSLADVGARTRVPVRHLEAIEQGEYGALPSPTYAVGFARAYARVVGVDEVETAGAVRAQVAQYGRRTPDYIPYELPDPARVPSRGLAILGAGAALALLILCALWFGTDLLHRRDGASDVAAPAVDATTAAPAPTPVATPVPAASGGQVRLTATDEVWMRVYDADDKTLFLGTMKPGDHFDVPQDAHDPMINVGRPDKLTVTLNGAAVASLGSGDHAIKDVKVSGAALSGKVAGTPAPATTPNATPTGEPSPSASRSPRVEGDTDHHRTRDEGHDRARHRRVLTETQRANIDSAKSPPAAVGNTAP